MRHKTKGKTLQTEVNSAVQIELNVAQAKIINWLVEQGLYGNTPRQVLMRIIDKELAEKQKQIP